MRKMVEKRRKGDKKESSRRKDWGELEGRIKKLESEGERKRREKRKRNIIIKEVKVKKVGPEGLREEIEGIVKMTR